MSSLFEPAVAEQLKHRIAQLTPQSERQWGTMSVAQTVAHCCLGMETATGDLRPPRVFISRILGPLIKPMVFKEGEPMRRNSPTAKCLIVSDDRELDTERERLYRLIEKFASGGPQNCSTHPHAFFGKLTPAQWSELMYKHLDHHLRQFGV